MRETDSNARKIVVGKDCYSKYCSKCPYCIKAYWEEKEGFKHGWIGIECCANCGKSDDKTICPNGIAYEISLGEHIDFDPKDTYIMTPEMIEGLKMVEEKT